MQCIAKNQILAGDDKLKVENISKKFKVNGEDLHVLDSISFDVQEGEFLTIVGPSGCGKTTLIRIIAGLEKPSSGKYSIAFPACAGMT